MNKGLDFHGGQPVNLEDDPFVRAYKETIVELSPGFIQRHLKNDGLSVKQKLKIIDNIFRIALLDIFNNKVEYEELLSQLSIKSKRKTTVNKLLNRGVELFNEVIARAHNELNGFSRYSGNTTLQRIHYISTMESLRAIREELHKGYMADYQKLSDFVFKQERNFELTNSLVEYIFLNSGINGESLRNTFSKIKEEQKLEFLRINYGLLRGYVLTGFVDFIKALFDKSSMLNTVMDESDSTKLGELFKSFNGIYPNEKNEEEVTHPESPFKETIELVDDLLNLDCDFLILSTDQVTKILKGVILFEKLFNDSGLKLVQDFLPSYVLKDFLNNEPTDLKIDYSNLVMDVFTQILEVAKSFRFLATSNTFNDPLRKEEYLNTLSDLISAFPTEVTNRSTVINYEFRAESNPSQINIWDNPTRITLDNKEYWIPQLDKIIMAIRILNKQFIRGGLESISDLERLRTVKALIDRRVNIIYSYPIKIENLKNKIELLKTRYSNVTGKEYSASRFTTHGIRERKDLRDLNKIVNRRIFLSDMIKNLKEEERIVRDLNDFEKLEPEDLYQVAKDLGLKISQLQDPEIKIKKIIFNINNNLLIKEFKLFYPFNEVNVTSQNLIEYLKDLHASITPENEVIKSKLENDILSFIENGEIQSVYDYILKIVSNKNKIEPKTNIEYLVIKKELEILLQMKSFGYTKWKDHNSFRKVIDILVSRIRLDISTFKRYILIKTQRITDLPDEYDFLKQKKAVIDLITRKQNIVLLSGISTSESNELEFLTNIFQPRSVVNLLNRSKFIYTDKLSFTSYLDIYKRRLSKDMDSEIGSKRVRLVKSLNLIDAIKSLIEDDIYPEEYLIGLNLSNIVSAIERRFNLLNYEFNHSNLLTIMDMENNILDILAEARLGLDLHNSIQGNIRVLNSRTVELNAVDFGFYERMKELGFIIEVDQEG